MNNTHRIQLNNETPTQAAKLVLEEILKLADCYCSDEVFIKYLKQIVID